MFSLHYRFRNCFLEQDQVLASFKNFLSLKHGFHSSVHIPRPNPSSLNRSMLSYLHNNRPSLALETLRKQIQFGGTSGLNENTIAIAFKSCCGNLKTGSQIHGLTISAGFNSYVTVHNSLISFYCKSGQFKQAFDIFRSLENPDIVSWNTILSGFQCSEDAAEFAVEMHRKGVVFDAVTYTTIISFCSDPPELLGIQIHSQILKSGFGAENYVGNALITMYSRWCRLEEAKMVFNEMAYRDLVSWNAVICGYVQEGNNGLEAILLFVDMVKEGLKLDHVSFSSAISACGHVKNLDMGRQVHSLALKTGYGVHVSVCNVLISMYSKCEITHSAKMVFESMTDRNVVSWTTMISLNEETAVSLFKEMQLDGVCPNEVTYVGLIQAISSQDLVEGGKLIHGCCIKTGFITKLNVSNSFITMYAKFEYMEEARKVFNELSHGEIVSWNALISGYAQNGLYQEALETFLSAIMEFLRPNKFTFGSVLNAIASAEPVSLRHGRRCHSHIIKLGVHTEISVLGALLDMYAKRGSIDESRAVFEETTERSLVAWTAIISAYSRHGDFETVMSLYEEMIEEGVKPDSITFLPILAVCGRRGMVDMGMKIFNSMVNDHKIEPSPEHYSSMVDMLGRAGRLDLAEEFMDKMPTKPGLPVLQSLLGSCRTHGNVELGIKVGEVLIGMEPEESGSYVLMSHMYAEKGEWEKVAKIRKGMRDKGVKKLTGLSWADVGEVHGSMYMHGFCSEDKSHPQTEDIYKMVEYIGLEMKLLEMQNQRIGKDNIYLYNG
ncbi:pentatricopeptide repeat-containing protein At4g32430, mitochondrial-like isoform X1 [Papaver somniferum]|uniref:pentatricopeptide repeat-containing protein At4g32430, mitochondrial-like isoform X1 n=1 Tax=Papaver somniferum TaxID=3469 RepID=UPI000E6F6049|nr:pentatricopeptide repeat-containing protein At4g32430, mitochondrial-like isoform X1 [Papaver somniferum]XP_026454446.1 pentatricopeptide repeat-containing protein At4g32430, mitochondrial-like isoform X1 [Papaver somniferum]